MSSSSTEVLFQSREEPVINTINIIINESESFVGIVIQLPFSVGMGGLIYLTMRVCVSGGGGSGGKRPRNILKTCLSFTYKSNIRDSYKKTKCWTMRSKNRIVVTFGTRRMYKNCKVLLGTECVSLSSQKAQRFSFRALLVKLLELLQELLAS